MSQNLALAKRSRILVCIQVLALTFSAGCGSRATPIPSVQPIPSPVQIERPLTAPVVGELAARYDEIHAHDDWLYPCDRINTQQIRDLLVELDSHAEELNAAVIHSNVPAGDAGLNWDGVSIEISRPVAASPDGTEEYDSYRTSWNHVLVMRVDIGAKTIQQSPEDWADLVGDARSLLADDADRVLVGDYFHLDHTSPEPIAELASIVSRCGEATSWECFLAETMSGPTRNWLEDSRMYQNWMWSGTQLRSYTDFKGHVADDAVRVGFVPNTRISRDLNGNYRVPVYSASFTTEATRASISQMFQRYWTGVDAEAEMVWVDRAELAAAILVGEATAGERSYYRPSNREVHLFAGSSTGSLAHEMGHAFGFKDQYYTVFDPRGCQYRVEKSRSNVMSRSSTGRVLERHWLKLNEMYPAPSASPSSTAVIP